MRRSIYEENGIPGEAVDIDVATHYCDDCDDPLIILYDDREDESIPIVCGHCGGNNTRKLDTPIAVTYSADQDT